MVNRLGVPAWGVPLLPGYEGGLAALYHEESSELFEALTEQAMGMGLNLVHDATMKTGSKATALVENMKKAGYDVEAHYMFLPPQDAAHRAMKRFLGPKDEGTGRFVPPELILGNTKNEANFDGIKPLVKKWSFWDNRDEHGGTPKLMEESGNAK